MRLNRSALCSLISRQVKSLSSIYCAPVKFAVQVPQTESLMISLGFMKQSKQVHRKERDAHAGKRFLPAKCHNFVSSRQGFDRCSFRKGNMLRLIPRPFRPAEISRIFPDSVCIFPACRSCRHFSPQVLWVHTG